MPSWAWQKKLWIVLQRRSGQGCSSPRWYWVKKGISDSMFQMPELYTRVCAYACWIGRLARDISVGPSQLSYSAFYTVLLV